MRELSLNEKKYIYQIQIEHDIHQLEEHINLQIEDKKWKGIKMP